MLTMTLYSSSAVHSLPSVAPSCTSSFRAPSRSSLAVNDACSVAGISVETSIFCRSDSSAMRVNSSTNNGTPSVLAAICLETSAGISCSPAISEIICETCLLFKRFNDI